MCGLCCTVYRGRERGRTVAHRLTLSMCEVWSLAGTCGLDELRWYVTPGWSELAWQACAQSSDSNRGT